MNDLSSRIVTEKIDKNKFIKELSNVFSVPSEVYLKKIK